MVQRHDDYVGLLKHLARKYQEGLHNVAGIDTQAKQS